jgi:short-subunit dehydrogenase
MGRRKISGLRAVVTGASGGIGREVALQLARRGARLVVTARRVDRLDSLCRQIQAAGGDAKAVPGDITDSGLRHRLLDAVRDQWGALDLLVNNAGVGAIGQFAEAEPSRLRSLMEVNFFAPLELIRASLPLLRQGVRPMIANIGSVLGHRAVPRKSEYCASKFALHGFSDSLRAELSPQGIDVLLVSPSTTETEFSEHLLEKLSPSPWRPSHPMSAEAVARKTVSAIERGSHEVILTWGGKLLVWLDRLAPSLADRLVARFS